MLSPEEVIERNRSSRHHIIPRSRKGDDSTTNISIVKKHWHDKYHALFFNRTPEEILEFLVDYFWNGNATFLENFLKRRRYENQCNERRWAATK